MTPPDVPIIVCARCRAGTRAAFPCSVCGNEDHMMPALETPLMSRLPWCPNCEFEFEGSCPYGFDADECPMLESS